MHWFIGVRYSEALCVLFYNKYILNYVIYTLLSLYVVSLTASTWFTVTSLNIPPFFVSMFSFLFVFFLSSCPSSLSCLSLNSCFHHGLTPSQAWLPCYLLCLHRTQERPSTPLGLFSTTTLNQQEPYMVVPGLWTNWLKLKSQIPNWNKQSWPTAHSWI